MVTIFWALLLIGIILFAMRALEKVPAPMRHETRSMICYPKEHSQHVDYTTGIDGCTIGDELCNADEAAADRLCSGEYSHAVYRDSRGNAWTLTEERFKTGYLEWEETPNAN